MRVLVLRPQPGAAATGARLRALGHDSILSPALTIEPTDEPCPPGAYAAVLLTSRNALPAILANGRRFEASPFYVVGEGTGEMLREAGFPVRITAPDATGLAAAVAADIEPSRLLHPGARDRKAEPADTLARAGFDVVGWTTYRAEPAARLSPDARDALAGGRLEAVLHYSVRSARVAVSLAEQDGLLEAFGHLRHLCLSPDVAEELASLPGPVLAASSPDERELLRLLG